MSDDEEVVSGMDDGPSEAELAMQKRRKGNISTAGLDESAQELLEENRKERDRMEEEIQELRRRSEQRKKERIEQEKEMAIKRAEEEARRKAEEEERKAKKDAEDNKRKAAREAKMAEFESKKNPQKPNFVISKKADAFASAGEGDDDERADKKSKEQMEAEKRAILGQRIRPLEISGFDSAKLSEKAKELNGLIYRLESEKYDLEKRFKDQQYDMMELAERARQMNQVGRGGLKRINLGPDESDPIQEKFAGAPAKIEMYSKFERQQDKRKYSERHEVFHGETWIMPPKKIDPSREIKWDENTGLPSYKSITGMEPTEEEEAGEE